MKENNINLSNANSKFDVIDVSLNKENMFKYRLTLQKKEKEGKEKKDQKEVGH